MTGDHILGRKRVRTGWFSVDRVTMQLNGQVLDRDLVVHVSGAALLPYGPVRHVALMVSETRLGVLEAGGSPLWEGIAGALVGDAPEDCARKEALEEAACGSIGWSRSAGCG